MVTCYSFPFEIPNKTKMLAIITSIKRCIWMSYSVKLGKEKLKKRKNWKGSYKNVTIHKLYTLYVENRKNSSRETTKINSEFGNADRYKVNIQKWNALT